MEKKLTDSILGICAVLNKHAVQYMIVGGVAVVLHGYFRFSTDSSGMISNKPDLDFWYNPTYGNYFSLLDALEELGQDVKVFKQEQAPNPKKSFFKFDLEKFTLDLLPTLKAALKFRPCFERRELVYLEEIEIPFISYADLIKDKQMNKRPKDIADIEHLKKNRPTEN